jgi:hypothetical protein
VPRCMPSRRAVQCASCERGKSPSSKPQVCTARRRILACSGTHHGDWKRRFGPTLRAGSNASRERGGGTPGRKCESAKS